MELKNNEIYALEDKMMNPSKDVICPRCGGKIEFVKYETAALAKCVTDGCIKMTIRGI